MWGGSLTVSQASGHAGWGEGVSLLGVHQLADRRQLVHLPVSGGAGAVGGLRRCRRPEGEEAETRLRGGGLHTGDNGPFHDNKLLAIILP